MPFLEYPKRLFLRIDKETSRVVLNADDEAQAIAEGFEAVPFTPISDAQRDAPVFLEFPQVLYRGDETLTVKNAEARDLALSDGWRTTLEEPASVPAIEPAEPVAEPEPESKGKNKSKGKF
jgi:hypothetical protein